MKFQPRHGMSRTRVYIAWKSMRRRCRNRAYRQYKDYGGRGISVCARWEKFENFYADMGKPPPNATLDRIDNAGNYEPNNCRWANRFEQANNARTNRKFTFNGRTLGLNEWARILKITPSGLLWRLKHWPFDSAFRHSKSCS
jgi:hypothetical protein